MLKLPIQQPQLNGRLHYGYILALLTNNKYTEAWTFNNFIQLYSIDKEKLAMNPPFEIDFYSPESIHNHWLINNPHLSTNIISKALLQKLELNIIELITNNIEMQHYVFTYVDEYYIPNTTSYMKRKNFHNILISGYIEASKELIVHGYFNGRYVETRISFLDFEKAFSAVTEGHPFDKIYLICNNLSYQEEINIKIIVDRLEEYLYSIDTARKLQMDQSSYHWNQPEYVYGLNIYDAYSDYLSRSNDRINDIRPIHTLWEHKKLMYRRIQYLENCLLIDPKHELSSQYLFVERDMELIRSLFLKFIQTEDRRIIEKINKLMDKMRIDEKNILGKLLSELLLELEKWDY